MKQWWSLSMMWGLKLQESSYWCTFCQVLRSASVLAVWHAHNRKSSGMEGPPICALHIEQSLWGIYHLMQSHCNCLYLHINLSLKLPLSPKCVVQDKVLFRFNFSSHKKKNISTDKIRNSLPTCWSFMERMFTVNKWLPSFGKRTETRDKISSDIMCL